MSEEELMKRTGEDKGNDPISDGYSLTPTFSVTGVE